MRTNKGSHTPFRTQALYHAARAGNDEVVNLFIGFKCDLEVPKDGQTPLLAAASNSHEEIVELLAKNKANLQSRDYRRGFTALHYAAENGLHAAMQSLLKQGANVNIRNGGLGTPLHLAANKNDAVGVKILLSHGANVSLMTRLGNTALHTAAYGGFEKVATPLIDHGAGLNDQGPSTYYTPLHAAAYQNAPSMVRLLLRRGAGVNVKQNGKTHSTALQIAAYRGNNKTVEVLLNWRPNLELKDSVEQTALHVALRYGKKEILCLLLKAGADANVKRNRWITPLIDAMFSMDLEAAKTLIDHGANTECVGLGGETLMHHAARWNDEQRLDLLISNNANINAIDTTGRTPLLVAAESSSLMSLGILLDNRAEPNHRDRAIGKTALHAAAFAGSIEAVSILLAHGADPLLPDRSGMLPLGVSYRYQQLEIEELLRTAMEDAGFKLPSRPGYEDNGPRH